MSKRRISGKGIKDVAANIWLLLARRTFLIKGSLLHNGEQQPSINL
jgi:hypothetical protein